MWNFSFLLKKITLDFPMDFKKSKNVTFIHFRPKNDFAKDFPINSRIYRFLKRDITTHQFLKLKIF